MTKLQLFIVLTLWGSLAVAQVTTDYSGGAGKINNVYNTPLWFGTNNSEKMRLDTFGRLGIGTTTPRSILEIASTDTLSSVILPRDTTANRNANPVNGMIRYNINTSKIEAYQAGAWADLQGGGSSSFPLLATPTGSAAAPAYSFSGDSDTGFYSDTADNVRLATAGAARLYIDQLGNVGVGSTSQIYVTTPGNVGVGTLTPFATAQLEVASTTKGFLPPRMTTAQRNSITSPATGLMIFNTTTGAPNYYSGSAWVALSPATVDFGTPSAITFGSAAQASTTAGVVVAYGQRSGAACTLVAVTDANSNPTTTVTQAYSANTANHYVNISFPVKYGDYYKVTATSCTNTGGTFIPITASGSSATCGDTTPAAISFTNQTGVTASTVTTSDIVQITSTDCAVSALLSGSGSPQLQTCSDGSCSSIVQDWTSSPTLITSGQYVRIRLTSSATKAGIYTATLVVGGTSTTWSVTTTGGAGYFVLTSGTWDGNLGGIAGANAKCLTDLTNNDWMGKTDATTRSLIDASHVKAVMCDKTTCNTAQASTTYYFAVSGSTGLGGASMSFSAVSAGPNDSQSWAQNTYFGGAYSFWMNMNNWDNLIMGTAPFFTTDDGTCNNFSTTTDGASNQPWTGKSANTDGQRWGTNYQSTNQCYAFNHLICWVQPL